MEKKSTPAKQSSAIESATSVIGQAVEIIDAAKQDTEMQGQAAPKNASVADSFKGLPMRELIAGPLLAAAEAQEKLAAITWDYYQKIGFNTDANGKSTGQTRTLNFTLNRPVEQNGEMKMVAQKVEAPFIGLVPIPSLLIDRIDVDFQMEVTDTNTSKSNLSSSVESKISAKWWGISAEVSGKVSSSRENTRTTNQTAKYQVRVTASQQPQTEGLSKLMDIMASCIDPIAATK